MYLRRGKCSTLSWRTQEIGVAIETWVKYRVDHEDSGLHHDVLVDAMAVLIKGVEVVHWRFSETEESTSAILIIGCLKREAGKIAFSQFSDDFGSHHIGWLKRRRRRPRRSLLNHQLELLISNNSAKQSKAQLYYQLLWKSVFSFLLDIM